MSLASLGNSKWRILRVSERRHPLCADAEKFCRKVLFRVNGGRAELVHRQRRDWCR